MLERGAVLAGYRIERMLGAGGMGVVYEATQLALGRTVALKVIAGGHGADPTFLKRFRREGQAQGMLDHPHVVPVYEAGETDFGLFLAMRLVRGPTLKDMIVARELDAGRSLRILRSVADALDAAHEAGMVHRDVKPQNILVASRDHPYLADFGLTQATGATSLTDTGQFVGTFDYISPEQIQGDNATSLSDVYALAGVLYECLTGIVPFPKRSRAAVIYAHLTAEPPRVTDSRPELPAALDDVVARGLAKDPASRPHTCTALIDEADLAFGRRMRAAIRPPGPLEAPEETGVRAAEANVSTAGSAPTRQAPAPAPPTAVAPVATQATSAEPPPRRRGVLAGALVAVIAVAIVGGLLLGGSGAGEAPTQEFASSASSGRAEIGFDANWRRSSAEPAIPGLAAGDGVVLASRRSDGYAVVTTTDAQNAELLPSPLLEALPEAPRASAVKLGEFEALRYGGLRPSGAAAPVDIYVVPTDKGVATVACSSAVPATQESCAAIAATLRIHSAKAYALGPAADVAAALTKALDRLAGERARRLRALRDARTPRAQALAAAAVARAYKGASTEVRSITASPRDAGTVEALAAAFDNAAAAYDDLSVAARESDRSDYRDAAVAAKRAEGKIAGALDALEQRGYTPRPS